MARIAVAVLSGVLCLCTGCFVFDEIDQGRELMEKHSGRHRPAEEGAAPASSESSEEDEGPGLLARIQAFWAERQQEAAPERSPDDDVVSCQLEDGATFTYQSDCLSRGGRVL